METPKNSAIAAPSVWLKVSTKASFTLASGILWIIKVTSEMRMNGMMPGHQPQFHVHVIPSTFIIF